MSGNKSFNSTFNNASGPQFNMTVNNPTLPAAEYAPPRRVNDAPMDLLAADFIGRLKELDSISQVFDVQKISTDEDVPARCAVHGMPGLGKTKLVLRFAQIAFAQLLYSHIFWMSAATTDKVIEGMAKILDLVGHPERTRSEQNAKLTAARLWLEDSQRFDDVRWLLIVDNVDKSALEFLREHLPRRNVKGNILFTTRASDIADSLVRVAGGHHSTLELRVPDLSETTHLLFSSAGIDASTVTLAQKNQAEELIHNLGSLPLAVVQAASFMRQTNIKLDKMLDISKGERKIEMIEWESDLATDQQRSVVATFNTLLDQLERNFPASYDVLRILSFLDPEYIPLAMLTDGAWISSLLDQPPQRNLRRESRIMARIAKWTHIRKLSRRHSRTNSSHPATPTHPLPELVPLLLSDTALPKALHQLQSLSLIEPLSRDGESSLRLHDLVHFITREHVKRRTAYHEWLESAASLVCNALQRVEDPTLPRWWPECEKFMPHVLSLSNVWADVEGVNLELATADVRLAKYLNSRGRYDDAERLCERSLGSLRKELGDKHEDTLWAFSLLAHIYYNQGRLTEAAESHEHVLVARKKELGADHETTLHTMNGLAAVYRRQDRYKEAEELLKRVVAVSETKLGPDHRETLSAMNNLSAVYDLQKRYDEAEDLLKHVLPRHEKHLGPDHVHTLATTNNLAYVYRSQTKYREAEELFGRVLVGQEKQIGPCHPETLRAAWNLAHICHMQGRKDEAERLYLRAFTGMTQQLGLNHPDTLLCAKSYASLYQSQGRYDEADALLHSTPG